MIGEEEMQQVVELERPVPGECPQAATIRMLDRMLSLTQQRQLSAEHYRLVADGTAFFRRYFILKSRQWRFAFLRLKTLHDLTDQQLQLLYFTGNLRFQNGEMRIVADRKLALVGWFFIAMLSFVYLTQAISLVSGLPLSWALAKACITIAIMAALTAMSYHKVYIQPWELARITNQPA